MSEPSITIIGGGFSGVSAAIHLLRHGTFPMRICIVEPREHLAEGLAFSSPHTDHRLNGPASGHSLLLDDAQHLTQWCERTNLLSSDPEAAVGGALFIRRREFARYVRETLAALVRSCGCGISVTHLRDEAIELADDGDHYRVSTRNSGTIASNMVIVATGNPPRAVPAPLQSLLGTQLLLPDPYELERLQKVQREACVLVVGTGLTAMDVVCTLIRQDHLGPITLVSRRGLRPRPHPGPGSPASNIPARIHGPPPDYTLVGAPGVRRWLAGLRRSINASVSQGKAWQVSFDELRDVVWKLWPRLPTKEQRRFDRLLRPWYDAHRFRIPGPTDAIVRLAEARGQLHLEKGRIGAVRTQDGRVIVKFGDRPERAFDAIVNATGFEMSGRPALLSAAIDAGLLLPAAAGAGLRVDENCCALNAEGMVQPFLRIVGPPTAGVFGDPVGTIFISAHIARVLPDVLVHLRSGRSARFELASHVATGDTRILDARNY